MVDGTEQAHAFFSMTGPFRPTHVSHKQVQAYPIASAEFEGDGGGKVALKGGALIQVPPGFTSRGAPAEGDMLVRYAPTVDEPDGYLSHSPRAVFDAGYSALAEAPAGYSPTNPVRSWLTEKDIEDVIVDETFTVLPSEKCMICELTLRNGFTVRGEACVVDPANFDRAKGERISRAKAVDQIWPLEGYRLQQRLFELAQTPSAAARTPGAQDTRSRGEPRP